MAILLALGALGWFGFSLNMFLNVMTPLIMVISFSDSMQITFAARDRLLAGDDKVTAFRNALLIVGPACVLTHATAGVSFIALQFSSSDLIRTFGEAGLVAVTVALVAVLMGVPLLGVLLIRNEAEFVAAVRNMDTALERVAPVLRLDRHSHGGAARALFPDQPARRRRCCRSATPSFRRAIGSRTRCPTASRRFRPATVSTSS